MLITKKLIYIVFFMILFFNSGKAEYEKKFFDFTIKNFDEEIIDLSVYKNKTVLLATFTNNTVLFL